MKKTPITEGLTHPEQFRDSKVILKDYANNIDYYYRFMTEMKIR